MSSQLRQSPTGMKCVADLLLDPADPLEIGRLRVERAAEHAVVANVEEVADIVDLLWIRLRLVNGLVADGSAAEQPDRSVEQHADILAHELHPGLQPVAGVNGTADDEAVVRAVLDERQRVSC